MILCPFAQDRHVKCRLSVVRLTHFITHEIWDLTHVIQIPSVHIILLIWRLTNFNPDPSASLTETSETDEGSSGTLETEGFPLLLMIVIPLAAGLLILMVAVMLALAVVIHLRNRNVYRSKYTVQLPVTHGVIFYLTQLLEL